MIMQTPVAASVNAQSSLVGKTPMRARGQVSPAFPLQTLLEWDAKCLGHTKNWICKMWPVLTPKCRTRIQGCSAASGTGTPEQHSEVFIAKIHSAFELQWWQNYRSCKTEHIPGEFQSLFLSHLCNKELQVYLWEKRANLVKGIRLILHPLWKYSMIFNSN